LLICVITQILRFVTPHQPRDSARSDRRSPDQAAEPHAHSHGLVDPSIVRSKAGVRAVGLSLAVLLLTSVIQLAIFTISDGVALLTDVIHNGGDALTAVPLGIAFLLRSRRGERWAGYCVVGVILTSALVALVEVVDRFLHPQTPTHLWAMFFAGVAGVIGNEVAAVIRWRAGRRLDSPALIADGNHARVDGYVSAGVMVSAGFIAIGAPVADPIIGLLIVGLILHATYSSWVTMRHS
jgi:cation diffusion facilitator family transporter